MDAQIQLCFWDSEVEKDLKKKKWVWQKYTTSTQKSLRRSCSLHCGLPSSVKFSLIFECNCTMTAKERQTYTFAVYKCKFKKPVRQKPGLYNTKNKTSLKTTNIATVHNAIAPDSNHSYKVGRQNNSESEIILLYASLIAHIHNPHVQIIATVIKTGHRNSDSRSVTSNSGWHFFLVKLPIFPLYMSWWKN